VAPRREAAIGLKSLGAYSAPKAKEIADELLKNPDSDIAYFLAKTIENIPDQSRITLPILIKYTNRYPPKAGSFPDFNQDVYKTFLYIRDYANTNNRINKGSVPIIDEAL